MKNCIMCGNEFESKYPYQICCSKECANIRNKSHVKSYRQKIKLSRLPSICVFCQTSFIKKFNNQRFCTNNCTKSYKKEYMNNYMKTDKFKLMQKRYENKPSRRLYIRKFNKKRRSTEKCKQYMREYKRRWKKTPIGRFQQSKDNHKRRALKNYYIELFTEYEWQAKKEATNGVCSGFDVEPHYVGIDKLTMDHKDLPVSKAKEYFLLTGKKKQYNINDVQPLCRACNCRKLDKIIKPKALYTSVSTK